MNDHSKPRPRHFGAQFFVTVLLVLIAAGGGMEGCHLFEVEKPLEENKNENGQVQLGLTGSDTDGATATLASRFTDADGDMLADPPADAKQFIDPPTLMFCYVADEEPEKVRDKWKPFCDYLSKATGKPVEYLLVNSIQDQLKALQEGKLQVSGLNTGAVPYAVNTAGFIPVCRVPTGDPAGTHVEIIVPAASSITKAPDLKGHELVFVDPSSNSGYKAPIVLLKSEDSLEPERDYVIRMSSAPRAVDRRHRQGRVPGRRGRVGYAGPRGSGTARSRKISIAASTNPKASPAPPWDTSITSSRSWPRR